MKDKELYLERIQIDETYSMQVEPEQQETLIIYENDTEIDVFSLRKRIYTLFKQLQDYTNADGFTLEKHKNYKLYGEPIHIKDDIYMQVNDEHDSPVIKFYQTSSEGQKEIIYIMRMTYTTEKLFHHILIPRKVLKDPEFMLMNPKLFKDFIDIMNTIKI